MPQFTLLPEHVAIARKLHIEWQNREVGAPCVDCKRPYGNSDHLKDIADIIGFELFEDDEGEKHFSKAQKAQCEKLHREMELALEIILRTGTFEPGEYEAPPYTSEWRKV